MGISITSWGGTDPAQTANRFSDAVIAYSTTHPHYRFDPTVNGGIVTSDLYILISSGNHDTDIDDTRAAYDSIIASMNIAPNFKAYDWSK